MPETRLEQGSGKGDKIGAGGCMSTERSIVHVLNDKQIHRKLRCSLDEAKRDDTIGLEDAYAYWMYRTRKGERNDSLVGRIALPLSIGALVGSILTRFFTREQGPSATTSQQSKGQRVTQASDSTVASRFVSEESLRRRPQRARIPHGWFWLKPLLDSQFKTPDALESQTYTFSTPTPT
jgi:hypothetical protein